MQNLTTKQKDILKQIENEFSLINEINDEQIDQFDICSLITLMNEDKKAREEIKIQNTYALNQFKDLTEEYLNKFNKFLNKGNIYASYEFCDSRKGFATFYIGNKNVNRTNYEIYLTFKVDTEYISFNSNIDSISKILLNKYILKFTNAYGKDISYKNINDLFKSDFFIDSLKPLIIKFNNN